MTADRERCKKLIEVSLPLDAINDAAAYDKMPGIGPHPKGIHKWWAPLPLPAARAVLFASLVDDPSCHPERFPTPEAQEQERARLYALIRRLVSKDAAETGAFSEAHAEIASNTEGPPPAILDPFCGGGSIPLEAQRLGLEAIASDLNPVAVLLTKALIEIPAKFAGGAPVNPESRATISHSGTWPGATGLAEDVRYYGSWMRDQALSAIGHLYPNARLPSDSGGTVIAWVWARTARCPNPACGAQMPLVSSFALSNKRGKNSWVEPVIDRSTKSVTFEVRTGNGSPPAAPKIGRGAKFRCLVCDQVADEAHLKAEGKARRIGARLMAMVAEGHRERIYLPPIKEHEAVASQEPSPWTPDAPLPNNARWFSPPVYGFMRYGDLFTTRQLAALTTFSDLIGDARQRILQDAVAAGLAGDGLGVADGGIGATAYADAVATYLAFAVDRMADFLNSICRWVPSNEKVMNLFGRQAIPMVWDFAEANPLGASVGSFATCSNYIADCIATVIVDDARPPGGVAMQLDAASATPTDQRVVTSTDPPYYDNIGYADLSDFFYVWLRRSVGSIWPSVFATILSPKDQELIASPYRHGSAQAAKRHFESGLRAAFTRVRSTQVANIPVTVYYAFKQSETGDGAIRDAATGWETILEALLSSELKISGTWPVRASQAWRMTSMGTNALASYIVLVCRPRPADAGIATRRQFIQALKEELPEAVRLLQHGNVAPVDLAQAALGPGMAVFSRYVKVVEASGERMPVRAALGLINQILDEVLTEQESDFDPATRFAIAWFETHGLAQATYGEAQVLAQAKGTTPEAIDREGFLKARGGKVQLLHWADLPEGWDPTSDVRLTYWEAAHYLIRAHQDEENGSEQAAAALLRRMRVYGETARELAYRLYRTCEAKKWTDLGRSYNALVVAWPEITRLADIQREAPEQTTLGG